MIAQKQREYYYRVLKPQRMRDRMWNNADKPKPEPKRPAIKTTKRFLAKEPVQKNPRKPRVKHPDLSTIPDIPVASNGVAIIKTEVVIDWNKL